MNNGMKDISKKRSVEESKASTSSKEEEPETYMKTIAEGKRKRQKTSTKQKIVCPLCAREFVRGRESIAEFENHVQRCSLSQESNKRKLSKESPTENKYISQATLRRLKEVEEAEKKCYNAQMEENEKLLADPNFIDAFNASVLKHCP